MKIKSCEQRGMEVRLTPYNTCTFQIVDEWKPELHAKTCDTMFYLRDGTGAYVWDCNHWTFLDFSGCTNGDWKAKEKQAGYIKNKPFQTLNLDDFEVDNGVLKFKLKPEVQVQSDWGQTDETKKDFIKNKPTDILTKSKADGLYMSLTECNRVFGETTFEKDIGFNGDIPWSPLPELIATGWTTYFGHSGYQIRNKMLTISCYSVGTQKALAENTNTTVLKIPNVKLPDDFTELCDVLPGKSTHQTGKYTLLKDGTLQIKNYEACPAQTGDQNNHFNFTMTVPVL